MKGLGFNNTYILNEKNNINYTAGYANTEYHTMPGFLSKHLENNDINTISVLPHLSTTIDLDKEYDIMNDKVKKVLDDAESKMIDLIDDFNEKVENDENDNTFQEIETSDLVMKIDDLKDYVEDYSN